MLLAVLPTVTVLCLLWLLKALSDQQVLFASLASSCFLIYLDPSHPANSARTLAISQLSAAAIGYALHAWLGGSYASAALSLVAIIAVMMSTHAMHPPAVGTALNFAFRAAPARTACSSSGWPWGWCWCCWWCSAARRFCCEGSPRDCREHRHDLA